MQLLPSSGIKQKLFSWGNFQEGEEGVQSLRFTINFDISFNYLYRERCRVGGRKVKVFYALLKQRNASGKQLLLKLQPSNYSVALVGVSGGVFERDMENLLRSFETFVGGKNMRLKISALSQ